MTNLDVVKKFNERMMYLFFAKICLNAYISNEPGVRVVNTFRFHRNYWKQWLNEEYNENDAIWQYMQRNY